MGSKSRAGVDRFEREQFLRNNGFTLARSGKGSHALWENESMKALAQSAAYKPCDKLKTGTVWQVTLCADPAPATWKSVVSHVEAVKSMLKEAGQREVDRVAGKMLRAEFNVKSKKYDSWKKAVKQELKAGVQVSAPPVSYVEVKNLQQQRFNFARN